MEKLFYDFLLRRWKFFVKFEMGLHNWEMNGNAFNGKIIIRRHWRHLVTEFIPWEIRQLSKSGQDNVKNWIQNYFSMENLKTCSRSFLYMFFMISICRFQLAKSSQVDSIEKNMKHWKSYNFDNKFIIFWFNWFQLSEPVGFF